MDDDPEKSISVALRQHASLMAERKLYRDALVDIRELVDGAADVDAGKPNLAMKIYAIVTTTLGETR